MFLQTFNIVRKYSGYADIVNLNVADTNFTSFDPRDSIFSLAKHHSQFVWFRKLFIVLSSYTFANSFKEMKRN